MDKHVVSLEMNGTTFSLETGRMARQANGAVVTRMGDTMSLMTVTADHKPSDRDFLPLFVEYRNKTYAAGKIPGGFFKREARPTERETLSARLIDRRIGNSWIVNCLTGRSGALAGKDADDLRVLKRDPYRLVERQQEGPLVLRHPPLSRVA